MSLKSLQKSVRDSLPLAEVKSFLNSEPKVTLRKVSGSLPAFLSAELKNDYQQVLFLTPDEESARFIYADFVELETPDLLYFPATAEKPYDKNQVTDASVLVQRSEMLQSISKLKSFITVCSVKSVFEKITAPEQFEKASIHIVKDQDFDPDTLREILIDQGYQSVAFVDAPGEIAFRGGILDVFPYTGNYPVRLEFFGNTVDSIREFDPSSQRSISYMNEVRLIPDVSAMNGQNRQSLFSYLKKDALIVCYRPDQVKQEFEHLEQSAHAAYDALPEKPNQMPEEKFFTWDDYTKHLTEYKLIEIGGLASDNNSHEISLSSRPQPDFNGTIKLLRSNIKDLSDKGFTTWILCDNDGQRDRFEELLGESGDELRYHLVIHSLHEGFILDDIKLAVYTDHQIFNRYHRPKIKQKRYRGGFSLKEIRDLKVGDYVVHVDYGIGQFQGFTNITVRNTPQEAVIVKYAQESILYVNVSALHKLQKYSGKDGAVPQITKLGSGEWARKKAKTKSRIKDIARDLIQLYAKRKAQRAHAFPPDTSMQVELEASFEFEETPDQFAAIEDVKRDMMSEMPMDRLVCGDVGFGKTEVAVRAAFKAVSDGKQVAVLVPTTILADQHAKTFRRRMKDMPVNIEMISRFRSPADIKDVLKRTVAGQVDILVGTHRITSKDVKFKDLGLLIVDEEQRFGVATKDKIKEMRAAVDVLTLTATPIPRTLQFSLMGARDLSVINTPPPNRQPVYTEIHSFDSTLIRDAILQEISRNGQVFFINNRINNIGEIAEMIRKLVPDVRVRFAHGQMTGNELEKIIVDFYAHKFDVLVSTNIVENGIDIPNANTIIINRADMFGLSELHQLRGRVGRSNRKAFCYLITPPLSDLSVEARKRLMALVEFSDLGSGFNIAMRDLDIRGAGDLLGGEQSGFVNDIGIELYTKILNDAVRELKETEFSDLFQNESFDIELPETTVEFDLTAILDKYYVSNDIERLNLYRKLANAKTDEEVTEWADEVRDRFGNLSQNAQNLVLATRIKVAASACFVQKVTIRAGKMWLECPDTKSERGGVFFEKGLFQVLLKQIENTFGKNYKLAQKDDTIRIVLEGIPDLNAAYETLKAIAQKMTPASSKDTVEVPA